MYAKISTTAAGQSELVAAVSGSRIRVMGFMLNAASAATAKFQSANTDKTGAMSFAANSTIAAPLWDGDGHFETEQSEALNLNTSVGIQFSGYLVYRLV